MPIDIRPSRRQLALLLGGALAAFGAPALAAPVETKPRGPRPSNEPEDFLKDPRKPASIRGDFSLVTIGDLLYSHPMADSADTEFQKVAKLIATGDVTIANREGMFFDLTTFKGENAQGGLWSEPALGKDMKALGVDMVSMANNHSTDWGWDGLKEAARLLDAVGIVHAGSGPNLQAARAAGILATPKGKVALVSTASTFKTNANAVDAGEQTPARPGISALHTRKINLVTADQFGMIRTLATQLASPLRPAPSADAKRITFGEETYQLSDHDGLHYEMDLYDHAGLLKAVREAKTQADLVVFTIHAHESTTGEDDDTPPPPDFLVKLFHDCIDAGADLILGGGPHSLRGIEIYKGCPIIYGIGVFFINGDIIGLQDPHTYPDATGHAPPPRPRSAAVRQGGNPASWYDGMVVVTDYKDARARTLRIHPLDLGNTYDKARRGIPHLADPTYGARILANLQKYSADLGTQIAIDGQTGVIRIP